MKLLPPVPEGEIVNIGNFAAIANALGVADEFERGQGRGSSRGSTISKEEREKRKAKRKTAKASKRKNR